MSGQGAKVFAALADQTRYRIIKLLIEGPMATDDLVKAVGKARSTVEEHLSVLLEAKLVTRRREDKRYVYEATGVARTLIDVMEGTFKPSEDVSTEKAGRTLLEVPVKKLGLNLFKRSTINLYVLSLLLGVLYGFINFYVYPLSYYIAAVFIGLIVGVIGGSVRELLGASALTALTVAIVVSLNLQPSLLYLVLSFPLAFVILAVIGLTVYLVKRHFIG